jgi:hypothetical protein
MSFEVLMLTTAISVACAIVWLLAGQRRFASPIFLYLVFHFVAFIIRPWSIYFDSGTTFMTRFIGIVPTPVDLERALWEATIGVASFTAAGLIGESFSRGSKRRSSPLQLDDRAAYLVGTTIIGLGLLSYAVYGVTPWSGDQRPFVYMNTGAGYKAVSSQTAYVTSSYILIAGVLVVWISKFGLLWRFVPLLVIYVGIILYSGFGRTNYVLAAFAIALALMHRTGKSWPPRRYIAPGVLVILSFIGGKAWFQTLVTQGSGAGVADAASNATSSTSLDGGELFINFDTLVGVNHFVPRVVDYAGVDILLRPIYFWVPRTIWPDKPLFDHAAGYIFANIQTWGRWDGLTVTLVGESYVAFGQAGVAALMFLYGLGYGFLHERLMRFPAGSVQAVLAISISASSVQVFRDGMISFFPYLLYYFGPCMVMLMTSRVLFPSRTIEPARSSTSPAAAPNFAPRTPTAGLIAARNRQNVG